MLPTSVIFTSWLIGPMMGLLLSAYVDNQGNPASYPRSKQLYFRQHWRYIHRAYSQRLQPTRDAKGL